MRGAAVSDNWQCGKVERGDIFLDNDDRQRVLPTKGSCDMIGAEAEEYITKGFSALDNDHFHLALVCFERAAAVTNSPLVRSALGLCIAAVRGEFDKGIALCRQAIDGEPGNTSHYYHLGRALLISGDRDEALQIFRQGLAIGRDQRIIAELETLGSRKPSPIAALYRDHFLNKWLGIFMSKVGFR
jgi:tetratricopeptide (TPR) repeat protein